MSLKGKEWERLRELRPKRPDKTEILKVERGVVMARVEVCEVGGQMKWADSRAISIDRVW